jgi:photosynthetic reaction center cytochrome c subunit
MRSALFLLILAASLIAVNSSRAQQPQPQQTAEQRYKNIQIFKGLPAAQLEPAMAFIAGSLGVKCNYCHVNPFDKDDKPTKLVARRMIKMVFDLNKGSFNGERAVSCFTCHRGNPIPVSVPVVGANPWASSSASKPETTLPAVKEILARYVQALGGAEALAKISSRVAKGSRIGADGVLVPEEVYQKAPDKILTITSYPGLVFTNGFNGSAVWGHSSKDGRLPLPDQVLNQIKIDSVFNRELKLEQVYTRLTLIGKTSVNDSEAYVIQATPANGDTEKLFFDVRSGLLVRRYTESDTILGKFPLQTDFDDFREVDGVKQPFLIRWSFPGRSWGRKVDEVKQNVVIDDAKFNPPAK